MAIGPAKGMLGILGLFYKISGNAKKEKKKVVYWLIKLS